MDIALQPHKLTEESGYRVIGANGDRAPPKEVEGQPGFVELRDMLGKTGGRVQDWKLIEHIEAAKARGWPMMRDNEFWTPGGSEIAICGGGPSLAKPENLRALRALQKRGVSVHAVNRTHDWLLTKGIKVDSAALLDPIPNVATYIKPRKGVRYYIASQCCPETLDVFEGYDKRLWHARASGAEAMVLTKAELDSAVASRTSSVGLRSVVKWYRLGARHFHLLGMDSSYDTDYIHSLFLQCVPADRAKEILNADGSPKEDAETKPKLDDEPFDPAMMLALGAPVMMPYAPKQQQPETANAWEAIGHLIKAVIDGKVKLSLHAYLKPETIHDIRPFKLVAPDGQKAMFYSNSAMAAQAEEFQWLINDISMGIKIGAMEKTFIYVHGSGMLPCIAGYYGLHAKKAQNTKAISQKETKECLATDTQPRPKTSMTMGMLGAPPPAAETLQHSISKIG